jgi:hypothetical protein
MSAALSSPISDAAAAAAAAAKHVIVVQGVQSVQQAG